MWASIHFLFSTTIIRKSGWHQLCLKIGFWTVLFHKPELLWAKQRPIQHFSDSRWCSKTCILMRKCYTCCWAPPCFYNEWARGNIYCQSTLSVPGVCTGWGNHRVFPNTTRVLERFYYPECYPDYGCCMGRSRPVVYGLHLEEFWRCIWVHSRALTMMLLMCAVHDISSRHSWNRTSMKKTFVRL